MPVLSVWLDSSFDTTNSNVDQTDDNSRFGGKDLAIALVLAGIILAGILAFLAYIGYPVL